MSSENSDYFSRETSPAVSRHPCVTCQRRKVRCDRKNPCTRCFKSGQECTQPEVFRAPRRPRRVQDANVLDRVRHLENSLEQMRSLVSHAPQEEIKEKEKEKETRDSGLIIANAKVDQLEDSLGRLIIEEERSRYASGSAWTNLAHQVGDLRTLLEDDNEVDAESPNSTEYLTESIFSSSGHPTKLINPQVGLKYLWDTYVRYVDPMMKVLHTPSTKIIIDGVLSDSGPSLTKSTEALLAAIKFGAVTSLSDEDCWNAFNTSREDLLNIFKYEVQTALNAANFLSSHELTTLQAFVIFLFCNRRRVQPSSTWVSCGIAIRIAQSIGVHRDGAVMKLPVLATEIRRRLFWEIRMLDLGSAEDCGFLPTHPHGADTKLPINCNDEDLHPGIMEPPPEREGFTDMTFVLIRYEMLHRLHSYIPSANGRYSMGILSGDTSQFPSKAKVVSDFKTRIKDHYLSTCNPSDPFQRKTLKTAEVLFSKMSLIAQYPMFQSSNRSYPISSELKETLFSNSCEIIENTDEMINDPNTTGWSWMMQTYVHWHPVAYILSELSMEPQHPQVERAWRAIDMAYANLHGLTFEANMAIWKPLKGLLDRAKMARKRAGLEVDSEYTGPASLPISSAVAVNVDGTDPMFLPDENLVPGDESLMAVDLTTPFATMSDFMTGIPDQYGIDENWWMNGGIGMAGGMGSGV